MHIKIASCAGFCYGVRRAVQIVEKLLEHQEGSVYSLGPIIHNPQAVDRLAAKGLRVVDFLEDITEGTVIIRAHGARPDVYQRLQEKDAKIVDTTCPFVRNSQRIAKQLFDEGYELIILGDIKHPEIISIMGQVEDAGRVVKGRDGLAALDFTGQKKLGVIAQTTQLTSNFQEIVACCIERGAYEVRAFDTICKDSMLRQDAVRQLCRECDLMLIVGGKMSANTKKLFTLCQQAGVQAYHIESAAEIVRAWVDGADVVGLASGASTPDWIIEEIKDLLISWGGV